MKKVIIIGSSIAGASAACLLAKHCNVVVYEQKAKQDIGKKLCANVVTPSFLKYVKKLGLNSKKYIISTFKNAIGFSGNQKVKFKTKEFKIDREKLIWDIIKLAQKKGAKFVFKKEFVDFKKKDEKYAVKFNKGKDSCDILIGADGPLSKVAKKAGLWKDRKIILAMQTEIPLSKLKKLNVKKGTYHVYVGKEKFGYYSYVFPSKGKAVIGIGDKVKDVRKKYHNLLKYLKVRGGKIKSALIPEPKIIPQKKDLFVIGDAGCHIKFSGGGIIPAMMAAEAVKEVIVNKNHKEFKKLNKRTFINSLATKVIWKLSKKDFDYLIKVLKHKKFYDFPAKRDEFGRKEYRKLLDLRILKFITKAF